MSTKLFHETFLEILNGEDPLDVIFALIYDIDDNINFNLLDKNANTISKIAPFFLQKVKKGQEFLIMEVDHYVAIDEITNVIYMCCKDLLMLDFDIMHDDTFIINHFSNFKDKCFRVYKSRNGYHIFCISNKFEYRNSTTSKFMIDNFSDFYYTTFCYLRGFCVRLNRKHNESISNMYQELGIYGNVNMIDQYLVDLTDKHMMLSKTYWACEGRINSITE